MSAARGGPRRGPYETPKFAATWRVVRSVVQLTLVLVAVCFYVFALWTLWERVKP